MKKIKVVLLLILSLLISCVNNVYAATCPLGPDVTKDLANILNIIQIAGPIVVIVVTIFEVVRTVSKGDIQGESKKLGIRLAKRVLYCLLLFFVPVLVKTGASMAQIDVSSCDLSNPSDNGFEWVTTTPKTLSTTAASGSSNGSSSSHSGATGFVGVAESTYRKITSGNYHYSNGTSIPVTGNGLDCSAFVSWSLYNYGLTDFAGWQQTTYTLYNTNWNQKYGWTEIYVSPGQDIRDILQPGDILVKVGSSGYGHTNVTAYVQDGKVYAYDCGSDASIQNRSGNALDKTSFALDNRKGKIIRVTT